MTRLLFLFPVLALAGCATPVAGPAHVHYLFTQVADEDAHLADPGFREILRTFSGQ